MDRDRSRVEMAVRSSGIRDCCRTHSVRKWARPADTAAKAGPEEGEEGAAWHEDGHSRKREMERKKRPWWAMVTMDKREVGVKMSEGGRGRGRGGCLGGMWRRGGERWGDKRLGEWAGSREHRVGWRR